MPMVCRSPRATGEDHRIRHHRRRREGHSLVEPGASGLGREVLLTHVTPAGLPPLPDLPHGREQHFIDRCADPEHLGRPTQLASDPIRIRALRRRQQAVDQFAGRAIDPEQGAHRACGQTGSGTSCDLVAHQTKSVHLGRRVATMLAGHTVRLGNAVPQFPRPQRGHRNPQQLGGLGDRDGLARRSLGFAGGELLRRAHADHLLSTCACLENASRKTADSPRIYAKCVSQCTV